MTEATATNTEATTQPKVSKIQQVLNKIAGLVMLSGITCKLNKNGNLYLSGGPLMSWSHKKNKAYTAGLNVDLETMRAFVNSDEAIKDVRKFLNCIPSKKGLDEKGLQEFIEAFVPVKDEEASA